jgi:hypothetical protein
MFVSSLRVVLLSLAVALGGCGPYVEPYRYIRLADAPDLKQSQTQKPDLSGLYFATRMPTRYRLQRPGYTVELAVPDGSYLPALELTVEPAGRRLVPADGEVPPSPAFCGAWYPDSDVPGHLSFGWSPNCADEQPLRLAFRVTDDEGAEVGQETLRFELDRNGWLIMLDAI